MKKFGLGFVPKTGGMKRAFLEAPIGYCDVRRFDTSGIIVQNIGGGSLLERPKAQLPQSARDSPPNSDDTAENLLSY